MSLNLTEDEIHGLIAYARGKFTVELYPFAPAVLLMVSNCSTIIRPSTGTALSTLDVDA